jgi:hypothetical protein
LSFAAVLPIICFFSAPQIRRVDGIHLSVTGAEILVKSTEMLVNTGQEYRGRRTYPFINRSIDHQTTTATTLRLTAEFSFHRTHRLQPGCGDDGGE